jgi:hypothetical protein
METEAQAWECGVHVLSSALNLLKAICFAISWNYCKNGQPVMRTMDEDPDITVHLTQGNDHTNAYPIEQVEVTKGKHTLGVRLTPAGTDNTEYTYCLSKPPSYGPTSSEPL